MPSLGADMEAGTLIEWRVRPGDPVKRGAIVAVVDTDKAAIEVEIFEDGVVESLLVSEGQRVPVGTVLAKIRTEGEAVPPPPKEPPPKREAPAPKVAAEAIRRINGRVEDVPALLAEIRKTNFEAPQGRFRFDEKQNVIFDLHIRRVEKADGKLVNVFVDRIPSVDQFWTPPQ